VQTINGQRAVTVLFNGSTFLVPVTVGLTDGRNTEITSGVNEGDTVVLPAAGTTTGGGGGGFGGGGGGPVVVGPGGGG
jgi:multidrug efflux pump subunit AcrA (membrane-fusion protein)